MTGSKLLQRSPALAGRDRGGPGVDDGRALSASTEPRPRGQGSARPVDVARVFQVASTEPRPRGQGSRHPRYPATTREAASTEPRPRGQGSAGFTGEKMLGDLLQRSPALAGRDRPALTRSRATCKPASTEPRPRGQGSGPGREGHRPGGVASTEPRPRGQGSPLARGPSRTRANCFNGAPPSRAGIGCRGPRSRSRALASTEPRPRGQGSGHRTDIHGQRQGGFNGAPPSRAGIVAVHVTPGGPPAASTEPRPRGQGSLPTTPPLLSPRALQRSPALAGRDRRGCP